MPSNVKKIGGALLALLTSLAYLVNIYIVKLAELTATSVSLTRGVLQILVFSTLILKQKSSSKEKEKKITEDVECKDCISNNEDHEDNKKSSSMEKRKPLFLAVLYGLLAASLSFSFVLGIQSYIHRCQSCCSIYSRNSYDAHQ